jgi:hypothetical protein
VIIEEITLTDIQDFMVREVATSAEFAALATSLGVTAPFSFYRGADLETDIETLPYFVSYKFNSSSQEDLDPYWMLQFIVGIDGSAEAEVDGDNVVVYSATDNVEKLAVKALGIIRQGISSGGLNGQCLIRLASANVLITEVGEADDVQAIVTLRFENYSTL